MVSFIHLSLYSQGRSLHYQLDRKLGGPRVILNKVTKRKIPVPAKVLFAVKGKGKVAPVLNQVPCYRRHMGKWRYISMHSYSQH
jgi:hypothetical protein